MKLPAIGFRHDVLIEGLKQQLMTFPPSPIKKEEEVQQNPDPHIDQDFPGFPHSPADKKSITPKTTKEKKQAGATTKKSKKTYGG